MVWPGLVGMALPIGASPSVAVVRVPRGGQQGTESARASPLLGEEDDTEEAARRWDIPLDKPSWISAWPSTTN